MSLADDTLSPAGGERPGPIVLDELNTRFEDLERRRRALLQEFAGRSPEQLAFRPTAESWSMLQVAQHLCIVEGAFLQAAERTGPLAKPSLRHRLQRPVLWLVFALGLRVRAPTRRVLPEPEPELAEIETRWQETRQHLHAFLAGIEPDQKEVPRFLHPVAGPLTPTGLLDFLSDHFEHHRRQLRRIADSPGFP